MHGMKKATYFILIILLIPFSLLRSQQKKVSDLTMTYTTRVTTGTKEPKLGDIFDGATTTVYIKGMMSRSEMASALASFTTIHDAKNSSSVILQEVSGQKGRLSRLRGDCFCRR